MSKNKRIYVLKQELSLALGKVSKLENMATKTSLQLEKLELSNLLLQSEAESLRKALVSQVNDASRIENDQLTFEGNKKRSMGE